MLLLGIGKEFAEIGIWLVSAIYKVAASAFQIFLILSDGSLLTAIDYDTIIRNFYLIIGIVMLFVLSFSLLKGMVNPEDKNQGEATIKKVITNLITSVLIMAVLPSIFTFAYDFQKSFINDYNPIGKFFGYGDLKSDAANSNGVDMVKKGANQIVNGVFTAFFNVNLEQCEKDGYVDASGNVDLKKCQSSTNRDRLASGNYSFTTMTNRVENTGDFSLYSQFAEQVDKGIIDFGFLLSLIASFIFIYVAVSFCFDMAIRLVKLAFYQIIAPIPIFFRVIPEGKLSGTFNTWVKVTLTCYLEVYVRIFVFYFCIYLCKEMLNAPFFDNLSGRGFFVSNLSRAFVIMGIITFMKSAPKLIGEITGLDSGNMKLGIREKLAAGGAFTAGAIVGGGVTSLVNNATNKWANKENWKNKKGKVTGLSIAKNLGAGALSIGAGTISGAARSGKAGWNAKNASDMKNAASSGAKAAMDARDTRASYKAQHGGTIHGAIGGHIKDTAYNVGRWAGFSNINDLLAVNKLIDEIQAQRKAIDSEAFDIIDGDLAKGKTSTAYAIKTKDKDGNDITYEIKGLRERKAKIDSLKASGGTDAEIAEAETIYTEYRQAWAEELRNIALKGETNWKSVDKAIQADLAGLRMATDKYRETVSRNVHLPFISSLEKHSEILNKEQDLTTKHSTLDAIKNELKIAKTENSRKINEVRQKEQDSKKK